MALPSVIQGLIESEDGKVFELDSPRGAAWVEMIGSFRFEPTGGGKPCTVRKETSGYWYGCRKVAGKVRKKYIGKSPEVTLAKLEKAAAALDVPPVPRVKQVAEVVQVVERVVQVAETSNNRLTALELQVANLQKALEALQERLSGKSEPRDSAELPKVDNAVAEELQNELGNLKSQNVHLRQKLAESQDTVEVLNRGAEALTRQLEVAQTENQRLHKDLSNLQVELSDLKQKSTPTRELPEAANILNQLKAKRKKSKTDLADLEAVLEILEG
jgi:chromosome segregation ATPase